MNPMYFDESHDLLRSSARRFTEQEILPFIATWEEQGEFPRALYPKAAEAGILGIGFPEEHGGCGGNVFHNLVVIEELCQAGSGGVIAGLFSCGIGLPPIIQLGTEAQKKKWLPSVLNGAKIAALAITEPDAGSDVAAIRTRAEKKGPSYVINGEKTFITSGTRADIFTMAVRTGAPRSKGISLVVVDKSAPGFSVSKKLQKMGWWASDTAELSLKDCEVPVENLLGRENDGFRFIMKNFEKERLFLAAFAYGMGELALKHCLMYAKLRQTFGEPLISKQTIRHRLAEMESRLTAAKAFVYHVAARFEAGENVTREIAMAKNIAIAAGEWAAYEAVQIHGGMGYMRECVVERIYRDMRILALGGGTTEIMREIISKSYVS